ncbi:MAG: GIY-YIG nuclease family protein [Oceanisphaera sp.]|uniref:GIY-YIG nuclease family protein n=1 Tax=Oceanisphaera sp. TaxID=1929979 RepID=UPI003F9917D7
MYKSPAVYILTNRCQGTLYIGVTSNLIQRIWQHKNHQVAGFTQRYKLNHLVYFELLDDMYTAISREKQLKNWKRAWKIQLIEQANPQWQDLWQDICG